MEDSIDLLIPRGSKEFVSYIMSHTAIPVLGHADGICHLYIDERADLSMALAVAYDAKTQYPAACTAVETILVPAIAAAPSSRLSSSALARMWSSTAMRDVPPSSVYPVPRW